MSTNKVNKTTGELVTLASGMRMWVGTKAAHDAQVLAGTMPNNCMVSIIDDYEDATVDVVEDGNMHPVTSNAVYDAMLKKTDITLTSAVTGWCQKFATKIGNVVFFTLVNPAAFSLSVGWNYTDIVFPEGYRPKIASGADAQYVRFPCMVVRVGTMGSFEINTNGTCRIYTPNATTGECLFVSGMFEV